MLAMVIIVGVALFCFAHGYIFTGIVCLVGFSRKVGFVALAITSESSFSAGTYENPLRLIPANKQLRRWEIP